MRRAGEVPSPFTSELIFQFTAAHLYEWDDPKRSDRRPSASVVDEDLLAPLLRGDADSTTGFHPRRLAGSKIACDVWAGPRERSTRWPSTLRLLGDLTASELSGPMEAFLAELAEAGRALVDRAARYPGTVSLDLGRRAIALRCGVPQRSSRVSDPAGRPDEDRAHRSCADSCVLML